MEWFHVCRSLEELFEESKGVKLLELLDSQNTAVQTTLYRPLAGALASLSAAAIVPSFSNLINSLIALVTTTSVSPSTRMYSLGFSPFCGSFPAP